MKTIRVTREKDHQGTEVYVVYRRPSLGGDWMFDSQHIRQQLAAKRAYFIRDYEAVGEVETVLEL